MHLHNICSGRFTISTDKRGVIAEFDNIITNGGLDRMAQNGDWMTWCQVGSGSSTPSALNTALDARIGAVNTLQATTSGSQAVEPYYTFRTRTYRFAPGLATGNISEVGVGWASAGGLFSRALILDGGGQPTTITVLADETLDVTYQFRFYPKTTDGTGTVTITGNSGATYTYIARAGNVASNSPSQGWFVNTGGSQMNTAAGVSVYAGAIGPLTGFPASPVINLNNGATLQLGTYTPGSYSITFRVSLGLNDGNLAGGIRCVAGKLGIGAFQFQFTPAIPKLSTELLTLDFTVSWGRVA